MGLRHWRTHRALREAARRYFTADELVAVDTVGGELVVHDARFRLGDGGLEVAAAPDQLRPLVTAVDDPQHATVATVRFLRRCRLGARPGVERLAGDLIDAYAPEAVLDIACATGELVRALEQRGVGGAAGIDPSEWAVEHRVARGVKQGTALDLPYRDRNFDLVVCQDVLEHVHRDDLPRVLAEIARVTRPGGHVLALVPFHEQFAEPVEAGAHLTQAGRTWWLGLFGAVDGLELARVPPGAPAGEDPAQLASYVELRRVRLH